MKVLIVDDEKITRDGLRSLIDWKSLGINNIYEASDGVEGLNMARLHHPDIILTDMRMPRMDGPAMAEAIKELLPDSAIIFMSGYSDKEYLKAAIHLKAVNYVEKPLDTGSVADTVRQAVEQLTENSLIKHGRSVRQLEKNIRLATYFTKPSHDQIPEDIILPDNMKNDDYFTSVIVRFINDAVISKEGFLLIADQKLSGILPRYKLNEIHITKGPDCLCIFLYGQRISRGDMNNLCRDIKRAFSDNNSVYIALGDSCQSITHAWDSYSSAIVMLQGAFFNEPGTILCRNEETTVSPSMIRDFAPDLFDALITRNNNACDDILTNLRLQFPSSCRMFPSQVRDIYYKLFIQLQRASEQSRVVSLLPDGDRSIWDMLENADTADELHSLLKNSIGQYFEMLSKRDTSSNIVFTIKEYIRQNYQNDSLSIKSISDHVKRSAPYICTFFKSETGITLNQYITGYRIERAREMLSDPISKITDVASRVGYNDVNYFGKIFKKVTGMSPSEYRNSISSPMDTDDGRKES
ncbi:MAG: response regulator [Lachnospiraceae bacterium]|nr:response regulator [Lachnospiraceae bacterium]